MGKPISSRRDETEEDREPPGCGRGATGVRSLSMDLARAFLDDLRQRGLAEGNFLGLLHLCIGRRIEQADGTLVCTGLTWRDLAALLKKLRWDREAVRELGLDPEQMPPRDRQRYWYSAICQANVDSAPARTAADRLVEALASAGYRVGHAPGQGKSEPEA